MALLIEVMQLEAAAVKKAPSGAMILEGVFQKGDEPNANRRVYPMEYLMREVERLTPLCKSRGLLGELDHPFYPDQNESAIIHSKDASHLITSLWQDGKTMVMGQMEVLDTPRGLILQEFIHKGVQIGVSSRSLGDVRQSPNGFDYVDESLKIITFDAVIGPSVTESKMYEAKVVREWQDLMAGTAQSIEKKVLTEVRDEKDTDEVRRLIREQLKIRGLL